MRDLHHFDKSQLEAAAQGAEALVASAAPLLRYSSSQHDHDFVARTRKFTDHVQRSISCPAAAAASSWRQQWAGQPTFPTQLRTLHPG